MRIAQLVESLDTGGLERMAVDLAIAHRQAGHESAIYTLFWPGGLAAEAEASGVRVVPFHKKLGFSWRAIRQLSVRLRDDQIQVLHTHNSVVHHYGVLAARFARVPAVVNTRHGVSMIHTRPIQETYFRSMIPLTHGFVFVCEDGRRFFEGRGVPRSRSTVIANGIPLDKWADTLANPGSRRPSLRCITVGRLTEEKGYDVLIDAFSLVLRQTPGITLQIVGDGPLRSALQEKVTTMGLEAHISLDGFASQPGPLLAAADLFILSSVSEGLPVVILEAMAAALPVVSTRVGGVPEIFPPEAGWLCEPGRADSLAAAVLAAVNEPDLMSIGRAARAAAFATFGIERAQRQYEHVFSGLLGTGAAAAVPRAPSRRAGTFRPRT